MSVRASLARLERSALRVFGDDTSPCRCGKPLVVVYHEMAGTVEGDEGQRCPSCGRERVRINVHIVEMPKPQFVGAGAA